MWRFPLCLLLLVACVPQSGRLASPETGLSGRFSPQVVVTDHSHHVLYAHVIVAEREGEITRAIVLSQRRDGVHSLRFREAWSGGVELPFRRGRGLDGCSHGHCLNRHAGMIFLSAPLFERAQRHGLAVRLLSGSENIDINVPAHVFHLPAP
jgi:hypothetical protein